MYNRNLEYLAPNCLKVRLYDILVTVQTSSKLFFHHAGMTPTQTVSRFLQAFAPASITVLGYMSWSNTDETV